MKSKKKKKDSRCTSKRVATVSIDTLSTPTVYGMKLRRDSACSNDAADDEDGEQQQKVCLSNAVESLHKDEKMKVEHLAETVWIEANLETTGESSV